MYYNEQNAEFPTYSYAGTKVGKYDINTVNFEIKHQHQTSEFGFSDVKIDDKNDLIAKKNHLYGWYNLVVNSGALTKDLYLSG